MFGTKDCVPDKPKKCKVPKPPKIIKEPECVEPVPPDYEQKKYFQLDTKDPVDQERAKCLEDCHVKPFYESLKQCERRVTSKLLFTAETCHEDTVYLMEALDKCVKDKAFKRLA